MLDLQVRATAMKADAGAARAAGDHRRVLPQRPDAVDLHHASGSEQLPRRVERQGCSLAGGFLPRDADRRVAPADARAARGPGWRVGWTRTVVMLGLTGMALMMCEGAMRGGIFLHERRGATVALAAIAVTAYEVGQSVGRAFGDRLTTLLRTVRRKIWWEGHGLCNPEDATTVRVRDGKTLITDGPFAEFKEYIAGFDIIEAPSLDDAVAYAAGHPVTRFGAIEVRQVWEEFDRQVEEASGGAGVAPADAAGKRYLLLMVAVPDAPAVSGEASETPPLEWIGEMRTRGVRRTSHRLRADRAGGQHRDRSQARRQDVGDTWPLCRNHRTGGRL